MHSSPVIHFCIIILHLTYFPFQAVPRLKAFSLFPLTEDRSSVFIMKYSLCLSALKCGKKKIKQTNLLCCSLFWFRHWNLHSHCHHRTPNDLGYICHCNIWTDQKNTSEHSLVHHFHHHSRHLQILIYFVIIIRR